MKNITEKEKFAWVRLARELKVLDLLAMEIRCDNEFQGLLGQTRMSGLSRALDGISRTRCEADNKVLSRFAYFGPDLFYGDVSNNTKDAVREIRENLRKIAEEEAVNMYGLKKEDDEQWLS